MLVAKDEMEKGQCLWDNEGNVHGGIVMGFMFLRKCLRRNCKGLVLKCFMDYYIILQMINPDPRGMKYTRGGTPTT